jgi:apolipoprotein N-acyltransferase
MQHSVVRPVSRWPMFTATRGATVPFWLAVITAGVGGLLNSYAFPARGWWPFAFIGTALIFWALKNRRVWASLVIGFVAGFAFFGNHILWITVYLGAVPWLALAGLESIFFALGMVLVAAAWRVVPALWPGHVGRLIGVPAALAGLWTLREAITSVWPYGGFSWGRLAFSQSDSPFAHLVAWLGISGLSFVMAWLSGILLQCFLEARTTIPIRGMVASGAFALVILVPAFPVAISGTIHVAAVQGNSDSGLFAKVQQGQILDDHLQATRPIINKKVDVVVWPENASDLDPLENDYAAQALDYVTKTMEAPLITGTITSASGDRSYNSLLLWEYGKGAVQQYDKIHPVPFAEYLPDRAFWTPFAPSLFAMIPRDFSIGKRPNVFDINGVKAGVAICFDIVDDALVNKMVNGGAEFIVAPTNNADFGHSDESRQQGAIARLRAIETGRSVVNDSTVGVTAMFAPDGSIIAQLPTFERGALVESVPLSTTTTLATVAGRGIEWLVGGFGLLALLLALLFARPRNLVVPQLQAPSLRASAAGRKSATKKQANPSS